MTRRAARRHLQLLAATIPLALWLIVPATASASCAMPIPIEEALRTAEIVIVGTVTSTENQGRWAAVQVHEIWKGPGLPATVVVRGGPGPGVATSVDRTFSIGARMLLTLARDEQGNLTDNACSSSTEWNVGLERLRPAAPGTPLPNDDQADGGIDVSGVVGPVGVALVVAVLLLAAGLLARGRQSA